MSTESRSRPLHHHLLVIAQLGGVALAVVPAAGIPQSGLLWLLPAALGMLLGAVTLAFNRIGNFSIYPEPRPGAKLVTGGPYRLVRHPMYAALVLMMVGIAGYNGGARHALGALLVICVVVAKALVEERAMTRRFADYAAYARRTPRFVPYLF